MKRTLSVAALIALVAAFAAGWFTATSAAEAASITKIGWWTSNPAAQAPEDGLNVSNGPNGPVSVGAVEISATTGLSRAVLILTEEGGIQADSAKLAVCTTPNEWEAGPAQATADAPKAECEGGQVELARNASSATWAADVTSLVGDIDDEGSVSLMVVPSGAATVPVGFEVRFQKPQVTAEADASSSGSATTSFGSTGSDSTSSSPSSSSTGGFSSTSGNSSSDSSNFAPTFDASATAAPVAPNTADGAAGATAPADTATAAETTPTTAPAELAALPTQASVGAATGGGNSTLQALFFVVVATLAGVGAGGGRWYFRTRRPDTNAFA